MATSFDEVNDRAAITVNDYLFAKAYTQGEDVYNKYRDGFLIEAISDFKDCKQSLDYDMEKREFVSDLTAEEIDILVDYWKIAWFERQRNNPVDINTTLQSGGGFKTHSAAQNLKEKTETIDRMREEAKRNVNHYLLDFDSFEF